MTPDAQMGDIAARAGVGLGLCVPASSRRRPPWPQSLVAESLDRFAQHGRDALATQASPWDAFSETLLRNLESIEHDAGTRHAVAQVDSDTWAAVEPARARLLHEVARQLISAAQGEQTLRTDFGSEDLEMVMRGICASMEWATGCSGLAPASLLHPGRPAGRQRRPRLRPLGAWASARGSRGRARGLDRDRSPSRREGPGRG